MGDDAVTDLIRRLSCTVADSAWKEFLARYSPLLLHVIRGHEHDEEQANELFAYVCGGLSDEQFRRLRSFRPDGPASFRTWLAAVVANLCVDWRRRQSGRLRPIGAVSGLPELDRQVYQCLFARGMSRRQCLEALAPRFPDLTETAVAEISARIFGLLTPQQRWQLSTRSEWLRWSARGPTAEDDEPEPEEASPEPGPDDLVAEIQQRQRLQDALARLAPEQRLLLRLRYEQELTLAEVARLTRQPDVFRANRKIQAALDALAALMGAGHPGPRRKSR